MRSYLEAPVCLMAGAVHKISKATLVFFFLGCITNSYGSVSVSMHAVLKPV